MHNSKTIDSSVVKAEFWTIFHQQGINLTKANFAGSLTERLACSSHQMPYLYLKRETHFTKQPYYTFTAACEIYTIQGCPEGSLCFHVINCYVTLQLTSSCCCWEGATASGSASLPAADRSRCMAISMCSRSEFRVKA